MSIRFIDSAVSLVKTWLVPGSFGGAMWGPGGADQTNNNQYHPPTIWIEARCSRS